MRITGSFVLAALALGPGAAAAADPGYLRISCPEGAEVLVDGARVGVCQAAGESSYLEGLDLGQRILRIERDGFLPAELPVVVGAAPQQVVVAELWPRSAAGDAAIASGSIEVYSEPPDCSLRVGMLWIDKDEPLLTIVGVAAGEHRLRLERFGVLLAATVPVGPEETACVRAEFTSGRVEVLADEPAPTPEEPPPAIAAPAAEESCIEYWVQVLRTADREQVEATQKALDEIGFPPRDQKLITVEDDGVLPLYKLRIGPLRDRYTAKLVVHKIRPLDLADPLTLAEPCGDKPASTVRR